MHRPSTSDSSGYTSEARDADVTESNLSNQKTVRVMPLRNGSPRTSSGVPSAVGDISQHSHPASDYSPMIGMREEYSPMVGIKIAAVLGGFFLIYALYITLRGTIKCSKPDEEESEENTCDEEQLKELDGVDSRLDRKLVSPKRDDEVLQNAWLEMPSLPLRSSNLVGLQCTVEIPDYEDRNCNGTDARISS